MSDEFKKLEITPAPTITTIQRAFDEIRERWPYAVLHTTEPGRLDFYLSHFGVEEGMPVATLDLSTGRLVMADIKNAYTSTFPHLRKE